MATKTSPARRSSAVKPRLKKPTAPIASAAAPPAITPEQRQVHEQWLKSITVLPTAAGRETRVIEWIAEWVSQRRDLRLERDASGNLVITKRAKGKPRRRAAPLLITAHLDHPAFIVRGAPVNGSVELEFRGGVHDPYFTDATIEIIDQEGAAHRARIRTLDVEAKPFKRVTASLYHPASTITPGDIGRWAYEDVGAGSPLPRVENGLLHTHACDDLAAVAAALSAFDLVRGMCGCEHVGLLFTRAEEVGFIGAIAACRHETVPPNARLICLENSRSFPHDSPIGAGPIVRVGDRLSVFEPGLTNQISTLMTEHQKAKPAFKFQRKLMPGGACEATAFGAYGHRSTCLCLPLGNYHNMTEIDGVLSGKVRRAKTGPEFISIDDYHGLIEMLLVCAARLDAGDAPAGGALKPRMEGLMKDFGFVLNA